MVFGLPVVPQSAPGSGPGPCAPAGPQVRPGAGRCRLGRPLVRAPKVVRVAGGRLSPPGSWAVARVGTGLCAISSLGRLEK